MLFLDRRRKEEEYEEFMESKPKSSTGLERGRYDVGAGLKWGIVVFFSLETVCF